MAEPKKPDDKVPPPKPDAQKLRAVLEQFLQSEYGKKLPESAKASDIAVALQLFKLDNENKPEIKQVFDWIETQSGAALINLIDEAKKPAKAPAPTPPTPTPAPPPAPTPAPAPPPATAPAPPSKLEAAFSEFAKSRKGLALLAGPAPTKEAVMENFVSWLQDQGVTKPGEDKPKSAAAAAYLPELNNAGATAAIEVFGLFQKAKKARAADKAEEPSDFFSRNKNGLIGGIILAIVGFFLGGPGGALLGGMLGFGAGNTMVDGNGVLSGLLGREQPSPKIARVGTNTSSDGTKKEQFIAIDAEGKAVTQTVPGARIILGHMEGEGDARKFVVTGVAFDNEGNERRAREKRDLQVEEVSGTLTVTKAGNIDVEANKAEIDKIMAASDQKAAVRAVAERAEKKKTDDTKMVNAVKEAPNAQESLTVLRDQWMDRLQDMGVAEADRRKIADAIAKQMLTSGDRKETPDKILADVLKETVDGKTVEAILSDVGRSGTGDRFKAGGGKSVIELFKESFQQTTTQALLSLNDPARGGAGKLEMPGDPKPKPAPNVARAQATARTAVPAAQPEIEAQTVEMKRATDIDAQFPPIAMPVMTMPAAIPTRPITIPNPTAELVSKALKETPGDEAAKRIVTLKANGKDITLVGTMQGDTFTAHRAVVQAPGAVPTPVNVDNLNLPANSTTFTIKREGTAEKLEIPPKSSNRANMQAIVDSPAVSAATGRTAPPAPSSKDGPIRDFGR